MVAPPVEMPVARVGIVGVGLVGGSIALALRERAPATRIAIVDREPVARAAVARGIADRWLPSVHELTDVDLIVLATPIPAILETIATLGRDGSTALVTDVGSTKRRIVEAARKAHLAAFVGGHPMAGRESRGLEAATPDLFVGRRWLIVPSAPKSTATVEAFVRVLGAEPLQLDAVLHDRTMAYVSHLPQLVSTALMTQAGEAVGQDGLKSAGPGLTDLTRLAGSSADVWQGILATNADFVREAATALVSELSTLAAGLDDPALIRARFERANRLRESWLGSGQGTS